MIVDEDKQYCIFKLEKSRKTYSDHSAILLKLNLVTAIEKKRILLQEHDNYQMWIQKTGTN